jgi:uncharacterized protein (DUF924 family)
MTVPMATETPGWAREVVGFWFGELKPEDWFGKSDAVDATIRDRFLGLHANLALCPPTVGLDPQRLLAAILVFDQFPRNMFRGTPQAFATDALALQLATGAIRDGLDLHLSTAERLFVYLPFEHSENADDQARAVSLITRLNDAEWTRYAVAHKDIIDRFGRFPHRNDVLGRTSTPEEIDFLRQPGSSF